MRELIYVPSIHAIPEFAYDLLDENEKSFSDLFDAKIMPIYWLKILNEVKEMHASSPFQKVYREATFKEDDLKEEFSSAVEEGCLMSKPCKYLIDQGAKSVAIEHELLFYLHSVILEKNLIEGVAEGEQAHLANLDYILEVSKEIHDDIDLLKRLCEDEKIYDAVRIRDKYIAEQIDQNLEQGERGIIFIGAGHKFDRILNEELKTDIKVVRHEKMSIDSIMDFE